MTKTEKVNLNLPKFIRLNKYNINMHRLMQNRLCLTYVNNNRAVKGWVQQTITDKLKQLVNKLVVQDEFDRSMYDELSDHEKNVFFRFTDICHVDCDIVRAGDFNEQYTILKGEYDAGNSEALEKLRKFISESYYTGIINGKTAKELLLCLSSQ